MTKTNSSNASLSNLFTGKALLVSSLFAVAATGCAQQEESQGPEGVSKAIPTAAQLSIKLPKGQSRALGEIADFYADTRAASDEINDAAAWALVLVHSVVQGPTNDFDGKVASWGPWTSGGVEYKVVVNVLDNGGYDYKLVGRAAGTSAAFETLLSGTTIPGATADTGRGQLTVDFDASERVLPSHRVETGKVAIKYDLAQHSLEVDVTTGVGGAASTLHHAYKGAADGGGDMQFAIRRGTESVSLHSRWQAGGAGRGDARVTAGGQAEVIASECWDGQFRVTYASSQVGPIVDTEGSPASCVFATAELPPR